MKKKDIKIQLTDENNEVEKLAILLALTDSKDEEKDYIKLYEELGYTATVTGIAGMNDEVKKKIVSSIVGAGLNEGVIKKTLPEMHAVIHATAEATLAIKLDSPVSQSFQLKAVLVRKGDWICVAMYGNMAVHKVTNHKTVGIGVMHL